MRKNNFKRKTRFLKFLTTSAIFTFSLMLEAEIKKPSFEEVNHYTVKIGDDLVGELDDVSKVEEILQKAKQKISSTREDITFFDVGITIEESHKILKANTESQQILDGFVKVLPDYIEGTLEKCYTLKINDFIVVLPSVEEVEHTLQVAISTFDKEGLFDVSINQDFDRGFSVLTPMINEKKVEENEKIDRYKAGFAELETELFDASKYELPTNFEDYDLGIYQMRFLDKVEVIETYLKPEEISSIDYAIEQVVKMKPENEIYKIVSGDTLGSIAIKTGIPMEELIAMNDALESEKSVLNIDQELIITVPKPVLTISYTNTEYLEEEYDADTIYIDNDEWYTTKKVTLVEPSTGFRKIITNNTYENGELSDQDILKEKVIMEAVAKVVERGTKVPPTYIKPLYGGISTSGFGWRSYKGGSNHFGHDWATPTGTTIMASSGGVVTRAGWGSGYGYVVYISHPDGVETRYAHNSKLLVRAGQTVEQGQAISYSGDTGDSTGPHLHFEFRRGGTPLNPLDYIE